jgi:hypothetical protein
MKASELENWPCLLTAFKNFIFFFFPDISVLERVRQSCRFHHCPLSSILIGRSNGSENLRHKSMEQGRTGIYKAIGYYLLYLVLGQFIITILLTFLTVINPVINRLVFDIQTVVNDIPMSV